MLPPRGQCKPHSAPDVGQGRLHACCLHCQQDPKVFLQFLSPRNEHCVREAASQEAHFDICRPNATEFHDCLSSGPSGLSFPHGHTLLSCSFKASQRTMTETMHFEYPQNQGEIMSNELDEFKYAICNGLKHVKSY